MQAALIGSDAKTIWMLPWFLKRFRQHNPKTTLIFAQFGDLEESDWKLIKANVQHIIKRDELPEEFSGKGWYLKPFAMQKALEQFDNILWLDIDIHVRAPIGFIFNSTKKRIAMSPDPFMPNRWLKRPQRYCTPKRKFIYTKSNYVYNTGLVLVRKGSMLLRQWCEELTINSGDYRGDEEAFAEIARTGHPQIHTFPKTVQWLRLYPDRWKKGAILHHYTGIEGHEHIRDNI